MSTMGSTGTQTSGAQAPLPTGLNPAHPTPRRHVRPDETKNAFKTTELLAYLGTLVAIVVTATRIGSDQGDAFGADKAMLYATIATVGYLISRGLAKSGSRHRDHDDD